MDGNQLSEQLFVLTDTGSAHLADISAQLDAGQNLLAIGSALRKAGMPGSQVAPLLSQAELQRKAQTKFGSLAFQLRFTPAGLEQATRSVVAQSHAQRYAQAGITEVADLGCGIGAESLQLLQAGLSVLPVEIDEITASFAQFNLSAIARLKNVPEPTVRVQPAETVQLPDNAGVFLDPARRTAGQRDTRRIVSPDDYMPSLTFAFSHGGHRPTGVKLGPGFERELLPEEAESQWVSVDHNVVETGVWLGSLAREGITRSALVIRGNQQHELCAASDSPDVPVDELGEYIYEPDGAVIRARLIGLLAHQMNASMVSDSIAYLSSPTLTITPFANAFQIVDELPTNEKQLKRALAERKIGTLEIKKRGVDVDPASLRKRLKLKGSESGTIIMTRVAGKHTTLLVKRCQ